MYYGEFDYAFGKYQMKAKSIPEWLSPILEDIKKKQPNSRNVNCCMINIYEDGHAIIRPHADDEPTLSPWDDICTVSVGADRVITFSSDGNKTSYKLESGSMLVMTREMQNSWQHSVEADPEVTDCRISLSFRHIDPVFAKSTVVIIIIIIII